MYTNQTPKIWLTQQPPVKVKPREKIEWTLRFILSSSEYADSLKLSDRTFID